MKRFAQAIVSTALLISGIAAAAPPPFEPRFYVGGEGQYGHSAISENIEGAWQGGEDSTIFSRRSASAPWFSNRYWSGSLIAGSRLNDNFAVEVGATGIGANRFSDAFLTPDEKVELSANLKTWGANFDVLGILPVMEELEIVGSLGLGYLHSEIRENDLETHFAGGGLPIVGGPPAAYSFKSRSSEAGIRAGVGVGAWLFDVVYARVMFRHQTGNKHIRHLNGVSFGLFYTL